MFGPGEVWGISVGSLELRAVKMSRDGDQVTVLEAVTLPYPVGEEAEALDRELKIRQALQTLVESHRLKGQKVAISVPGNSVFSKFITLPPVEKKRVPEIVKYESRQQIPFPIEEVVWDYQSVKAEPLPGEEIEVALFAIRREIIQSYISACLGVGLFPSVVQAAPLAFCNFLQYDQPSEDPLVILDVAQDGTELVIVDGERVWPRSIAVGSQDLTQALMKKFQIPFAKAEELKAQAAKSKQGDRLFGVMKPVLQNLAGQVQRTLGFYKSQHPEVRFGKVVLVGDFFEIPGVESFFKDSLRYEFDRLQGPKRLELDEAIPKAGFPAASYAVAMGLGLQALGLERLKVNLILPEHIQQRKLEGKRPWVAAAVLLLGVAVLFDYLASSQEAQALLAAQTEAEEKVKRFKAKEAELQEALKAPPGIETQLSQLPALLGDRHTRLPNRAYSDVLRDILGAVPAGTIWIDSLAIKPEALKTYPKADLPAWAQSKEKLEEPVLIITLKGQKISKDSKHQELEFVNTQLVKKLGGIPHFRRAQEEWVQDDYESKEISGQLRFIFTIRWYLDPEPYLKTLTP